MTFDCIVLDGDNSIKATEIDDGLYNTYVFCDFP